ncbi:response regulator transcription factor [Paenibacillus anseongensis]|nr:response regulator [Paenibacillus sp. CGMCC 1.16610]
MNVKMLIVDDEPIICEGLRYTIPWEELGVQVIGEAYNGTEALRLAEEHKVNLVLTDIRMNGMDGLELAEHLMSALPNVRIVIISGYEDFAYARQAVRLGVSDYLLKPVDIDELLRLVRNIVAKVRKEAEQVNRDNENRMMWLSNVVRGVNSSYDFSSVMPALQPGAQFRMIATQMNRYYQWFSVTSSAEHKALQEAWMTHVHLSFEKHAIHCLSVFDHTNLLFTLCVDSSNRLATELAWNEAIDDMLQAWQGPESLYGSISTAYDSLADTAEHCDEARLLLNYHVLDEQAILTTEFKDQADRKRDGVPEHFPGAEMVQNLMHALFRYDLAEIETLISDIFGFFRSRGYLLDEAAIAYGEIRVLLQQRLRESGIKDLDALNRAPLDLDALNSYVAISQIAKEDLAAVLTLIEMSGISKPYWIIEKAKKYILEHNGSALKAADVAAWLKITPSYFSYIFKQSTGKSFTEYVNQFRIEQAKQLLLQTHDKVYEIADKVGYKEYKYFVSIFKTYTGMTPTEYRDLNTT